ncbi:MAG: hypothetical protein ACO1OQ_01485 [Rufibacter sp.]
MREDYNFFGPLAEHTIPAFSLFSGKQGKNSHENTLEKTEKGLEGFEFICPCYHNFFTIMKHLTCHLLRGVSSHSGKANPSQTPAIPFLLACSYCCFSKKQTQAQKIHKGPRCSILTY